MPAGDEDERAARAAREARREAEAEARRAAEADAAAARRAARAAAGRAAHAVAGARRAHHRRARIPVAGLRPAPPATAHLSQLFGDQLTHPVSPCSQGRPTRHPETSRLPFPRRPFEKGRIPKRDSRARPARRHCAAQWPCCASKAATTPNTTITAVAVPITISATRFCAAALPSGSPVA